MRTVPPAGASITVRGRHNQKRSALLRGERSAYPFDSIPCEVSTGGSLLISETVARPQSIGQSGAAEEQRLEYANRAGAEMMTGVHVERAARRTRGQARQAEKSVAVTEGYYDGCTRVYVMNSFHLCHLIKLKFHICIQHFKLE